MSHKAYLNHVLFPAYSRLSKEDIKAIAYFYSDKKKLLGLGMNEEDIDAITNIINNRVLPKLAKHESIDGKVE